MKNFLLLTCLFILLISSASAQGKGKIKGSVRYDNVDFRITDIK